MPAKGSSVSVSVDDNTTVTNGQNVFVEGAGYFSVNSKAGTTVVGLTYLNYSVNTAAGNTISAGAQISPAGTEPDFSGITALTDNTGGSASDTLAVGVGVSVIPFFVNLADLANHDLVTQFVLGYNFKILSLNFIVEKAATTAAKAATIAVSISGTPTTGGSLALTSSNCTPQGNVVAASPITAANTGSSTDNISITGSSVTAFVEGNGVLVLTVKNMDVANSFASLAAKVNAMLAAT